MCVLLLTGFLAEDGPFCNLACDRAPVAGGGRSGKIGQDCGIPVGERLGGAVWPFLCFLQLRHIDKQVGAPILARSDLPCA
ncbi:hypothetical protein IP85_11320 [Rhizobium sp. AAP116]|nr:hypothetical protein IP85_11320 [Rhizobium sp. AAP116]